MSGILHLRIKLFKNNAFDYLLWKVMTNVFISLLADKDECTQISGLCGNGTCVNTAGSFRCSCHNGFRLDRRGYCRGEKVMIAV